MTNFSRSEPRNGMPNEVNVWHPARWSRRADTDVAGTHKHHKALTGQWKVEEGQVFAGQWKLSNESEASFGFSGVE